MKIKKIATILTVFNRKQKTLACLNHLFEAAEAYNEKRDKSEYVDITVYMTDDGCTDGTAAAVRASFPERNINILQGNGELYWAGGMRFAWQAAIDSGTAWDYYLLLNDDTYIYKNVFDELFEADAYGFQQTGVHGLSSGITCQPGNPEEITYGGMNFASKTKGKQVLVTPTPSRQPQRIDLTHANILLVHASVIEKIGIFNQGFIHGCADFDYSMTGARHGICSYLTSDVCGECEYDHQSQQEEAIKLCSMSLKERKKFVNTPNHCDHDYLLFVRRNLPLRYPMSCLIRFIRVYFPRCYYGITNFRGIYQTK